jgi:hypothetical protein
MDFYEHISKSPYFTDTFGLKKDMLRAEAIEKVRSLDKNKLYATIDALPDKLISDEFKRFLFKNKQEFPGKNNISGVFNSLSQMFDNFKKKYL